MSTPPSTPRTVAANGNITEPTSALPAGAVAADGDDLVAPSQTLLQGLYLLGTPTEMAQGDGFNAFIGRTPQSVSVIESAATAISKWWTAGLGAVVIAAWGSVVRYWGDYPEQRNTTLLAAAIVSAAALVGIAYVVGSDVIGRSQASVATINARRDVATTVTAAARALSSGAPTRAEGTTTTNVAQTTIQLPAALRARSLRGADTDGWLALLARLDGTKVTQYLLVKGESTQWTDAADVVFAPPPPAPQATPGS
ncbi:MAG TPA: hypothetical protein VFL46_12915 [Phycicoccus sp.]|nr:hypothetical protein [Phycicoccus sp.]